MKKAFIGIFALLMVIALAGCTTSTVNETATPEEQTSAPAEASPMTRDELEACLKNVFTLDGFETLVIVEDEEANVYLLSDTIASVYADASTGGEAEKEAWNSVVDSFLKLHDKAREFIKGQCDESLTTAIVDNSTNIPYIIISDGEITIDFLNLGQ